MAAKEREQQVEHASWKTIGVDLLSGTVAGTAQLMVGHPFDTIKVKMQSQSASMAAESAAYQGPFDAAKQTLLKEGPRGFYKGLAAPLTTVALFNAVLFAARGQMEVLLAHTDGSPLTVTDQMVAGVGASAAVSLVATPTELLKCRLQVQGAPDVAIARLRAAGIDPSTRVIYRGPLDVMRHVVATEGGALGLMRGLQATLLRETLGNIAMFGVYELLKQQIAQRKGLSSTSQLSNMDLMLSGGCAGTSFWLACFPADMIKSKLQVDSYSRPRYSGILDCGRQVVQTEGLKGLWRGFVPALLRSFPANAACFAVYEASRAKFGSLLLQPS